jgi:EPS-associated MarR family transcriptional regulator
MASRRKEHQEDAKLRVLNLINGNPQMTTRELAKKVGISNGSAYYLLTSLIDKGYVKLLNFSQQKQKLGYVYLLTPKGIREKSLIANKFLVRKKQEFEELREEINALEEDVGNIFNEIQNDKSNNK